MPITEPANITNSIDFNSSPASTNNNQIPPRKRANDDVYNVSTYTDAELFDILDLTNPTDRELEAKILFLLHKYENMQNADGNKLAKFFDDIYNHFFVDEVIIRQENDPNRNAVGLQKIEDGKLINYNIVDGNIQITNTVPFVPDTTSNRLILKDPVTQLPANEKSGESIVNIKSLDYAPDNLNPIKHQTTKRIISIDSQYRDNKTSLSTEFTFNLSENLKDVVALKLYSVQIPYSWYTVNNSFGSNFIYIKGTTPGIDNDYHNIQIDIEPGNYDPITLTKAINDSITVKKQIYTDVSFGTTNFAYNSSTIKSTATIDIIKMYNETSYKLEFPYWTTPHKLDTSRNESIPGYLGFEQDSYDLDVLNTQHIFYETTDNTTANYLLTSENNYFRIIKYKGFDGVTFNEYVDVSNVSNVVDMSFTIQLGLPTGLKYSRNAILSELNTQLLTNPYLSNESYMKIMDVSSSNFTNSKFYQMKLKINRSNSDNQSLNSKIVIKFPEESPVNPYNIWTSNALALKPCFGFLNLDNKYLYELNNIVSEYRTVLQLDKYEVKNNPYILLSCNATNFDVSANYIQIDVSNSTIDSKGYSMNEYMAAINYGILNANNFYSNIRIDTSILSGTIAYIDSNDMFNLNLNINKVFDESMYEMDLTGYILFSELNINNSGSAIINNLTQTHSGVASLTSLTINSGEVLAVIYPKNETLSGNQNDISYSIIHNYPTTLYTDTASLVNAIKNSFISKTDPNGNYIFDSTNFTYDTDVNGFSTFNLTVKINKVLTVKDYNIRFIDQTNTNSWTTHLKIDVSMCNNIPIPLDISLNNSSGQNIVNVNSDNTVKVIAAEPLSQTSSLTINSTRNNNLIKLVAYEEGVFSVNGVNDILLTIPSATYTRNSLITKINEVISSQKLVTNIYGTAISIFTALDGLEYAKIRMNVNRTYKSTDYNIVFYDPFSFVKCYTGVKSVRNTTWDTTLGWLLGFHKYTVYFLSSYVNSGYIVTLTGDTVVNTNLFNYFMLCLDDYNQNHLNDGLVTMTGKDLDIPLPSYANRINFQCDPTTGAVIYNPTTVVSNSKLTQNQIYSITQISNSGISNDIIDTTVTTKKYGKSYGSGPFIKDVFGLIPMKIAGLSPGASFIEYGGTLQNQDRSYFGPVNIRRISVKLVSDRGDTVDLNGGNWSFSLICESLSKL